MKKYEQPDFSIHNTLYLFFMFVTLYCFNFSCLAVLEKNVTKTFSIHDSSTHCPLGYNVSTFKASQFLRKVWQKHFNVWKLERKKKEKIKGQICNSHLILVYTTHPPIVHACTKFQLSRPNSSWEKCDKSFNFWILEKEKIKKKGTNKQQQPDSGIHHTSTHCPRAYQVSTF